MDVHGLDSALLQWFQKILSVLQSRSDPVLGCDRFDHSLSKFVFLQYEFDEPVSRCEQA